MIILIAVLFQTHLQIFTWKEIKKNYQTFPEKTHDIFLIIPQIKDLKVLQYIKHVILFFKWRIPTYDHVLRIQYLDSDLSLLVQQTFHSRGEQARGLSQQLKTRWLTHIKQISQQRSTSG